MIKQPTEDNQPSVPHFVMLWLFSLTAFLVAAWFLFDSITTNSAVGMVVSGMWLVNIVVGSFFIHVLLFRSNKGGDST